MGYGSISLLPRSIYRSKCEMLPWSFGRRDLIGILSFELFLDRSDISGAFCYYFDYYGSGVLLLVAGLLA